MTTFENRVYGIIGISSKMANWNADFTGYPKSLSNGDVFASDKALKYTMKKQWENEGEKILYLKSFIIGDEGYLKPRTLKERYEQLFDVTLTTGKKGESELILKNLFSATDVKNFGATFAEAKNNISITGAVQITQGMNKYEDTIANDQQILSPFRDPKAKEKSKSSKEEGEEAKSSTLGNKIVSEEAHYFYSFVINPLAYKEYIDLGVTDGYTGEDYKKFKNVAINSATSFATNAKAGADNEFAMFVVCEQDTYLPNLSDYIAFEKTPNDEKDQIIFKGGHILEDRKDVLDIEIYYNHMLLDLVHFPTNIKKYDIFTKRPVEE